MKKMAKRFFSILLVTILVISALCQVAFAEETVETEKNPKVQFVLSEPDDEGYLTASFVVYNAFFSAYQFGISFDKSILQFVDKETKEISDDVDNVVTFNTFENEKGKHKFLTLINELSNENGTLRVGSYSTPTAVSDFGGRITVGDDGFVLCEYSMKLLKKENPSLALMDYVSNIYPKEAILSDGEGNMSIDFEFVVPELFNAEYEKISIVPVVPEPSLKELRKERLVDSLILNIGNFAAVDDGYLKVIDESNREVVPFIEADRTYLPLRFIGEAFGAEVNWNPDSQEIKVTLGENVVVMNIGKTTYTVDGEVKEMDVAPFIKEDRTFIPVRYIGEALNKAVYWDGSLKLVIVTAEDKPWDPDGKAEKDILPDALLLMSEMVRDMMLSDVQ